MTARSPLSAARSRRLLVAVAAITLACGAIATGSAVASTSSGSGSHAQPKLIGPPGQIGYAVNRPLCDTVVVAGRMNCFAMQRVAVKKGTPGAYRYLRSALTPGPAGGYTPHGLATVYGYNPTTPRAGQTVGIVDWFDDAHIASDLKFFDHHYGLRAETARSFRKVNQKGAKSPLPSRSNGKFTSGEISLDVETVRAVCQTCRILLVEANAPTDTSLSIAENTAVRMGASEISNSFGAPEPVGHHEPAGLVAAFNHPGVAITASTGDDGWFGWDFANNPTPTSASDPPDTSQNAAEFPATDPDVVSVGGVGFTPGTNADTQYVWNNNGPEDNEGFANGAAQGAGGGGCSQLFTAKTWQSGFPGYTAAGCGGKRLSADVSDLADPATGFDEYNTWVPNGEHSGWVTVGGTSLASPIVAALFALAGGPGGAAYPSESLYTNAALHPTALTDITVGGNSFCGGVSPSTCGGDLFVDFGTHNPNAVGAGNIDCSFPHDNSDPVSPPPASSECNAVAGFDGPSGIGAPHGVGLFASTSPRISLTVPKGMRLHKSATFTAHATALLPGAHITAYKFAWGDGSTATTGVTTSAAHTYTSAGSHTLTLTVTDSAGQQSVSHTTITLGKLLSIKLFGTAKIKAGHKDKFEADVVDPNTDGSVKKIQWSWGDHKTSTGGKVSHVWRKAGKYTVTVTATDNLGAKTKVTAKITVS